MMTVVAGMQHLRVAACSDDGSRGCQAGHGMVQAGNRCVCAYEGLECRLSCGVLGRQLQCTQSILPAELRVHRSAWVSALRTPEYLPRAKMQDDLCKMNGHCMDMAALHDEPLTENRVTEHGRGEQPMSGQPRHSQTRGCAPAEKVMVVVLSRSTCSCGLTAL